MRTSRFPGPSWPFGAPSLAIPGLIVLATTLLSTSSMWSWPIAEWVQTSQQFHEQLLLVAPFCAAVATYFAGHITAPSRIFSSPASVRSGVPVVRRHLVLLNTTFLVSYLLGLAPLVALTVVRSQAEGPYLLTMLTGLIGLLACTTAGYLVGVLARSAWSAPFVFAVGFVLLQSTNFSEYRTWFAALDPVTNFPSPLGRFEATPVTVYRLAFFVLVTAACAILAAESLRHVRRIGAFGPSGVILVLAVAAAIALPAIWRPALLAEETGQPAVCQEIGTISACVHTGHRSELAAVHDGITAALRVSGDPDGLRRVRDIALATPTDKTYTSRTAWVHITPNGNTKASTVIATAQALAGGNACPVISSGAETGGAANAATLAATIAARAGVSANMPTGAFDRLSTAQFRHWIAAHRSAIGRCALTNAQLP